MKRQNRLLLYITLALLAGVLAALLVIPFPKGGRGDGIPMAKHAPSHPHHMVEGQDDLLHRLIPHG